MLAHMVYFTLKEPSDEARARLVAACKEHLSGHPGQVFFACGTLCRELARDVNVRDWDVALHIVFETKEDHDRYQEAERHVRFVEENGPSWSRARVFDSVVEGV